MGLFQDQKFRVKNTFLELVEEDEAQPKILQTCTDSAILCNRHHECETELLSVGAAPLKAAERGAAAAPADLGPPEAAEADTSVPAFLPSVQWAGQPTEEEEESGAAGDTSTDSSQTTVMLRNLPNDYTRAMLLELLDASGFKARYDFVYLPVDFTRMAGLGYAFVNLVSGADARRVRERLGGFRHWAVPSTKTCSVCWSNPCQGLEANIERYRNSPIMHPSVPDEVKPAIYANGERVPFPRPTKRVRKRDMSKYLRRTPQ